ncbi:hypothetical protein CDCA_CDCA01G0222 [Cyanidium caldarium]|uniref:Phosphofructokinase domain-containing protein n=1 Tax=Cyanidium caldarium TaxID=2771 RepID=A0AAV9IPK7_CYACA|nr:hypothetical protein CDCA_CDCA01G0222 [Cyanidium caldarium]
MEEVAAAHSATMDRSRSDRFLEETEGGPRTLRRSDTAVDLYHPFTKTVSPRDASEAQFDQSVYRVPHLRDLADNVGRFPSPLATAVATRSLGRSFVPETETILADIMSKKDAETVSREYLRGGPREYTAFHPKSVKAAIVTCGGLCPGINTVIRELYMTLTAMYGVEEVYGVRMGYRGFYSPELSLVRLTSDWVSDIHHRGGSVLGSSRGGFDLEMIVSAIAAYGFRHVYIIGGDGTQRGAQAIFEECCQRRMCVSVVGIPKTIDNDIAIIDNSFGFVTAVEEAQRAIRAAHVEAISGYHGIGLVRLMGRHSGYISMFATLASGDVDVCLIPEIEFDLAGDCGLLSHIERLLDTKGHCVIVVAEGAGLSQMLRDDDDADEAHDASGNVKLPNVGIWLSEEIKRHFRARGREINLKYLDPSYEIRSVPPVATDTIMCTLLAQSAVHGAMAGYTGFICGVVNTHHVMIPLREIVRKGRTRVDLSSRMWHRVLASTLQPPLRNQSPRKEHDK